eukprot:GHVT01013942.1.p1 GENE.GHVT01013942.1~~GHVT01013942.1.p1  ORF type:complete len:647 (+),score=83.02 GHVT01013942.1:111-2051(+)
MDPTAYSSGPPGGGGCMPLQNARPASTLLNTPEIELGLLGKLKQLCIDFPTDVESRSAQMEGMSFVVLCIQTRRHAGKTLWWGTDGQYRERFVSTCNFDLALGKLYRVSGLTYRKFASDDKPITTIVTTTVEPVSPEKDFEHCVQSIRDSIPPITNAATNSNASAAAQAPQQMQQQQMQQQQMQEQQMNHQQMQQPQMQQQQMQQQQMHQQQQMPPQQQMPSQQQMQPQHGQMPHYQQNPPPNQVQQNWPPAGQQHATSQSMPQYYQQMVQTAQAPYGAQRREGNIPNARVAPYGAAPGQADNNCMPVSDLNQYQPRWRIKARVLSMGDIRKFQKPTGEVQVQNFEIADSSGSIRATMFSKGIAKWQHVLQEGKVFYFSGAQVKPKNAKFNKGAHGYELTIDDGASIEEAAEDEQLPKMITNWVTVQDISKVECGTTVDVLAVVKDFRPKREINTKLGPRMKQDISLVDETCASISVTLWGKKAEEISEQQVAANPFVGFLNVMVSEFNGRSLSSGDATRIILNPAERAETRERTIALQNWWAQAGPQAQFANLSMGRGLRGPQEYKTILDIQTEAPKLPSTQMETKGAYFTVRATVVTVNRDRFSWPACPTCKKKMEETPHGVGSTWRCSICDRDFPEANHSSDN